MTYKIREVKPMLSKTKKRFKKIAKPNAPELESRHRIFRLFDFQMFDFREGDFESDEDENPRNKTKKVKKDTALFRVQMFGINEFGETCLMYVDGYNPFFYLKVGNHWTSADEFQLEMQLRKELKGYYESSLKSVKLVEHNKLYDFTGDTKFKFIKLTFSNINVFNKVRNLWYTSYTDNEGVYHRTYKPYTLNNEELYLYESKIPPLLRYLHIYNICPSGWVEITEFANMEQPISKCDYEYICNPTQIKPLPQKETPVPYKICSFDIEASSSHGDFPLPRKDYKRLSTQVVDYFIRRMDCGELTVQQTAKAEAMLKKLLLAGFGIGSMEDIDLVYPKTKVTKEMIKIRVNKIIKQSLKTLQDELKSSGCVTKKKKAMKITSMLQQIAADSKALTKSTEKSGDDDDNTNEDNIVHTVDSIGGFGSGIGEVPEHLPKRNKDEVKKQSEDTKLTLVQILLQPEYNRENKIRIVNETLTMDTGLPELKGDEVTFIGSTFMKYGEKEPYKNHCLVVGSCDPIKGAEIESVPTEAKCLTEWTRLIQQENPDIIIGYNIFGFDYEFMFQRAQELDIVDTFMSMSRILEEVCYKENFRTNDKSLAQTKNRLASGDYDLRYPSMSGRLQIDLLFYFRRDYNLASYKLDDVAGSFIRDDIKGIVSVENGQTHLYSKNIMGLHTDDFIHLEITTFTVDYYQKGKKFRVKDILKNVEVDETNAHSIPKGKYNVIVIDGHYTDLNPKTQALKWGMSKDDVTPQDIFRLSKESAKSRAIVAKYCIQDCNLVQHLMNKTDVLTGYNEMARICTVPISFLVFRGQGIKLTSYVAKVCREKNTLMPDLEHKQNDDGYEGAIVLPPKCAMYGENPVACNDYSSLYPSIAKGWNLSPNSKVWTKLYNLKGELIRINDIHITEKNRKYLEASTLKYDNLPEYEYIETEFDHFETVQRYTANGNLGRKEKVKCGKKVCRWAQFPNGQEGIVPCIIGDLLKARKETRKKAESESDPFLANVLDKRQLGYKVTANSLYGQMGSSVSTFYEKDVAASITSIGRQMIIYAKRMVEEIYGDSVYTPKNGGEAVHIARTRSQYVYGDSVANYTPIYVRISNKVDLLTVEELADKYGIGSWVQNEEKEFCEMSDDVETWTEKGWTKLYRVIRHALAPHKKMIRVLTHTGVVDVTDDHSLVLNNGVEISPKQITETNINTIELLHHSLPYFDEMEVPNECCTKLFDTQVSAALFCACIESNGYNFEIDIEDNHIKVTMTKKPQRKNPFKIKKMHEIQYEGYVYDLTTDNHHFAAGVGNLIVHNTDSVFFTFNLEDADTGEPIRGKRALELTIEIAQESADLCSLFLPPPMKLAYEKTLMSFILLSKKRYVGMLYENDPNKGKLKFMGLPLKRRDSCDYVKDVYGGILTILMKEPDNIQKAIEFLNTMLTRLVKGEVSMEKLAITKSLRSEYKNPKQIAHRVLADRMGDRDPGNKPKPGDRIKYVFVQNSDKNSLLGERIETPEYIVQNKVPLDYTYYITNQLMNPLQQLLGLALEKIYECKQKRKTDFDGYYKIVQELEKSCTKDDEQLDLELFMKKREKYCSTQVKQLLFDPFLTDLYNEQNGIRTLFQFYKKKNTV